MAEAAAKAMAESGLFDGMTPPLTAGETVTFEQIAGRASEMLGREVRRELVDPEEYRRGLMEHGYPVPVAEMLLSMFAAIRDGEFDAIDPALERVLGRRPAGVEAALRAFLNVVPA